MNRLLLCAATTLASLSLLAGCGHDNNDDDGGTPPAPTAVVTQGPITQFGSVFVDGVEYDTGSATFDIDTETGTVADLAAGKIVSVGGTKDSDGNYTATVVNYRADVRGPVGAIDTVNRTVTVLGRTISVRDSTVYSGFEVLDGLVIGDIVEVSGYAHADGSLLASWIAKEAAPQTSQLRGEVSALDTTAKTFRIGPQVIDYTAATIGPNLTLANGTLVLVLGSSAGASLDASLVRLDDGFGSADDDITTAADVAVTGAVETPTASSFSIGALDIGVTGSTTYSNGTAADLVAGALVDVTATRAADGTVTATAVAFHPGTATQGKLIAAIDSVDAAAGTMSVLGVTVKTAASTIYGDLRDGSTTFQFSDLAAGDWVEASYHETADGLIASLVERVADGEVAAATGPVDAFDATAQTLDISGVDVDASSATFHVDGEEVTAAVYFAGLNEGGRAHAGGTFSAGVLTATDVSRSSVFDGR